MLIKTICFKHLSDILFDVDLRIIYTYINTNLLIVNWIRAAGGKIRYMKGRKTK